MTFDEAYTQVFGITTAKPPQPFQPGDVCLDSFGRVGMITATEPDENRAWLGVHLAPDRAGEAWYTKKPKRILTTEPICRFVKMLEQMGV